MSVPGAPRFSAWPGLKPQPAKFEAAPADVSDRVEKALDARGAVERVVNAGEGQSYLRFTQEAGPAYFIKVVPEERARDIERAERLARWLRERGAPVLASEREPRPFGGGMLLFAYPYVEGRLPSPTIADARALGLAAAKLHAALAAHPDVGEWRRDTAERLQTLERVRSDLRGGGLRAGPDPDRLARLARDDAIDFGARALCAFGEAAPLHGDLNVFNVLMTAQGPLFLDLEDVHHSVLPPALDIATLCERVVLMQEPDDVAAHAAMRALVGAYAEASGSNSLPLERVPPLLRALALRALCTRAQIDPRGADHEEWMKFFFLMDAASGRSAAFGSRRASA